MDELLRQFEDILKNTEFLERSEIPNIALYMDQVLSFMSEHLRDMTRDPEADKILTKTMINNYVKNDVLMPPDRKKYDQSHMMILMLIYFLKSFLSIEDIRQVLKPIKEISGLQTDRREARAFSESEQKKYLGFMYDRILEGLSADMSNMLDRSRELIHASYEAVQDLDLPEHDREQLSKLYLVCQMSAEIYLYKLFMERMIDQGEFS